MKALSTRRGHLKITEHRSHVCRHRYHQLLDWFNPGGGGAGQGWPHTAQASLAILIRTFLEFLMTMSKLNNIWNVCTHFQTWTIYFHGVHIKKNRLQGQTPHLLFEMTMKQEDGGAAPGAGLANLLYNFTATLNCYAGNCQRNIFKLLLEWKTVDDIQSNIKVRVIWGERYPLCGDRDQKLQFFLPLPSTALHLTCGQWGLQGSSIYPYCDECKYSELLGV